MTGCGGVRLRRRGLLAALTILASCNSQPTVTLPPLEALVASGDGQYGTPGQTLVRPLQVMVRTLTGQVAQVGTSVSWQVVEGDATIVGSSATSTDEAGVSQVRIQLGGSTGRVVVQATALTSNNPSATFEAFSVDRPVVDGVAPSAAPPGETVTVTGSNFSPDAAQNVVLLSGIRARVTSATETELTFEVPDCLPARTLELGVQLGIVRGATVPFTVTETGTLVSLPVGGSIDVSDDPGFTCLGLPGVGRYLAIVYSSGVVGAAKHPALLTGVASAPAPSASGVPMAAEALAGAGSDPQATLDRVLRELEDRAVDERPRRRGGPGPLLAPSAAPPAVGERRSFDVYRDDSRFTRVTAVARFVGARAALFVDETAPGGGPTLAELQAFSDRFDQDIHPRVTETFGSESDLDGNERIIILFTPAVNALTPRGTSGFVAGFFFGIDLLPEREGSNDGEVFYTLVPDPAGLFSDPRSTDDINRVVPSVLAHEFQHMVHFNERVLVREAESTEAVWLSEAMAQFAEEVVARAFDAEGDADGAELFRSGSRSRARRYLQAPDTVSLIISIGSGSLVERGAGILYALYLDDQFGTAIMAQLTRTTRTGIENVEVETGRSWAEGLIDWWSAVYLDGPDPETGPAVYEDLDLRGWLGNPYPLVPVELGAGDFGPADSLWSASAAYYIVSPGAGGSTSVRLSGESGGPSSPEAGLRMRVIRIS